MKKTETLVYDKLINYINSFNVGDIITRKAIMSKKFGWHVTVDNYRNHLTNAGFLEHVGRGIYRLTEHIVEDINSRDLRKLAYPHYKNWHEYKHLTN